MHILAAPDKFRGTASAVEIAEAIAQAAESLGHKCHRLPLADGGEGTVDALGGANRSTVVTGPLGEPVAAKWRLDGDLAIIEMAAASGITLSQKLGRIDPYSAATTGTGELIVAALRKGAKRLVVGLGGSASTDGGAPAVRVLREYGQNPFAGIDVVVCSDVRTRFLEAAVVFGPQKGADPATVESLSGRLRTIRAQYLQDYGIDVQEIDGSGAAGGLAGGLAALGARVVDGFGAIAEFAGLDAALRAADLVVTGEGRMDNESFNGKLVGGVIERAAAQGVPVLVVAGAVETGLPIASDVGVINLSEMFGSDRSMHRTLEAVAEAVGHYLERGNGANSSGQPAHVPLEQRISDEGNRIDE